MSFDGNGDYIENTSGFITAYPFTISAWIRPAVVNITQFIAAYGDSTSTSMYRGIELVNANAVAVARNNATQTAVSAATLVANTWYHIV